MGFLTNDCIPFDCKSLSLFLLMYADDLVLFSESVEGLQSQLDYLCNYSREWGLEVNIRKTKVMVFRKGGRVRNFEQWVYNGQILEIIDRFTYIGILLYYNNRFWMAEKQISDQGRKAFVMNTSSLYFELTRPILMATSNTL